MSLAAVTGYASLFGVPDLGGDVVERGAFAASLASREARFLYQHDPAEPIGRFAEIREDGRGLFIRAEINRETRRGRDVFHLLRQGAIEGLSIGFNVRRSIRHARTGRRHLLEVDLWEVSIVTFPMLEGAGVEALHVPGEGESALFESFQTGIEKFSVKRGQIA